MAKTVNLLPFLMGRKDEKEPKVELLKEQKNPALELAELKKKKKPAKGVK